MKKTRLESMVRGWFVGNFEPVSYKTDAVEVGVKHYAAGDRDDRHYHKIAVELTLVLSGQVVLNGQTYTAGDILEIEPGEVAEFAAVTDAVTVVVKLPSVAGDKYSLDS